MARPRTLTFGGGLDLLKRDRFCWIAADKSCVLTVILGLICGARAPITPIGEAVNMDGKTPLDPRYPAPYFPSGLSGLPGASLLIVCTVISSPSFVNPFVSPREFPWNMAVGE